MANSFPEIANQGINTPPVQNFNTPAMEGSLQQFLADNIGQYVVVEFLVGTNAITTKAGILYAVGTSVMTLYQELTQTIVTCDMFSIKFVTFYLPGRRPWQISFPAPGMGQWSSPGPWGGMTMPPQTRMTMPGQTGMMGQTGTPAPGFSPPEDFAISQAQSWQAGQDMGGCCGNGPSWG